MKRCIDCRDKHSEYLKTTYLEKQRAHGKSDKQKESRKKHSKTDKRLASNQKYWDSDKGKALRKKIGKTRREKERHDPALKLKNAMQIAFTRVMSEDCRELPAMIKDNTKWKSVAQIRKHFEDQLDQEQRDVGYGTHGWTIAHRIARFWYDHSNPVDVKNCWSPDNMMPMMAKKNKQGWVKIDDEECYETGVVRFPVAWKGVVPSEAEKAVLYASVHAG